MTKLTSELDHNAARPRCNASAKAEAKRKLQITLAIFGASVSNQYSTCRFLEHVQKKLRESDMPRACCNANLQPPQAAQAQLWISDARDVFEGFVAFFDLFG